MKAIDRTVQAILEAVLDLQQVWHEEDEGSVWRSSGGGAPVSGGGQSNPTMQIATTDGRHRYRDAAERVLEDVRARLEREVARQRPKQTGPCNTDGCEGEGLTSQSGRCDKCSTHWRRNGYAPPRKLVQDWNSRRPRPCSCGPACCPDGCLRMCGPGERTHTACRKAQQRAREQEAS